MTKVFVEDSTMSRLVDKAESFRGLIVPGLKTVFLSFPLSSTFALCVVFVVSRSMAVLIEILRHEMSGRSSFERVVYRQKRRLDGCYCHDGQNDAFDSARSAHHLHSSTIFES